MGTRTTARIHLLPAKEAPYVVIVWRKPSKTFHIIRWNTETDELEHGSWFSGRLYEHRSDVSFDGQWMVYMAMGAKGIVWNGCCKLPFLKTFLEGDSFGTWNGGGYWKDRDTLVTDNWANVRGSVLFKTENHLPSGVIGKDSEILSWRMKRDGWQRSGPSWGIDRKVKDGGKSMVIRVGDDGWSRKLSPHGPLLEAFFRGYLAPRPEYEFRLAEYPGVLDSDVEWATVDCRKNLVFASQGWVFRYSQDDLRRGQPGFAADLNGITKEATQ
jgi:hypothetical protein